MKKFLRITGILLGVILLLLGGALLALQTKPVQNWVAAKVLKMLDGTFNGQISVGSISLLPFSTVIIEDAVVTDQDPYVWDKDPSMAPVDTFARVGYAAVKLSLGSIFRGEGVLMKKAIVRNGEMNLTIEPNRDTTVKKRDATNLERIFNLKPVPPSGKVPGKIFEIENVEVENFVFRMKNYPQKAILLAKGKDNLYEGGIDWNDMELVCDVRGRHLGMEGKVMHGTADHVEIYEKSGLYVDHVSGSVEAGDGKTLMRDIRIQDAHSDVSVPRLDFLYGDQKHFNDFLNGVRLVADIAPSKVDLGRTIGYFAPALLGNPIVLDVKSGGVDGPISDLGIKPVSFTDTNSGLSGTLEGRLTGLPETDFDLRFKARDLSFTTASLGKFIKSWAPGVQLNLGKFAPRERFRLNATGKGNLNRLAIDGNVSSTAGGASFRNLLLQNLVNGRDIAIGGNLSTASLDLGRILGVKQVGPVTLTSQLQASLGKNPVVTIDSLHVGSIRALDYTFRDIRAQGVYSNDAFDGRIVSHDPNLDLMAQGLFNVSGKSGNSAYEFYVNLGYADLGAIGIDPKGGLKVALNTDANFIKTAHGDLVGDIIVTDVSLTNDRGTFDLGDVSVQSHFNDEINRMKFASRFFDGTYVSTEPITAFISQLTRVARSELPALFTGKESESHPADYDLSFTFNDTGKLLEFLSPQVYIENNTRLDVNLDRNDLLTARLSSGRLALGDKYLKNFVLDLDNKEGSVNAAVHSDELSLGGIKLKGAEAILYADDNLVGADIRYDNRTEVENKGDISLAAELRRNADGVLEMAAHALPSSIIYNGNLWRINSEEILLSGKDISIDRFGAYSEAQSLLVDGGISSVKADTLSVRLDQFDLSLLNGVIGGGYDIRGRATGSAFLTSPTSPQPGLLAAIRCDSTSVAGSPLGQLNIGSKWNEEQKRFDLDVTNRLEDRSSIDAHGWINGKGELDVAAALDRFNIGYVKPIMTGVFSTFDGGLSGEVRATGSFKDLHLSGRDTRLDDAHLTLEYTKVPYTVSGPVSVSEKGLVFEGLDITDSLKGTGKVTGGVYFNTLKDISLDVLIRIRNMLAIDTHEGDDPSFYGKIIADGSVQVKGPLSKIDVDINARTSAPGEIHIPLNNASGERSTLLTFTEPVEESEEDPYELLIRKQKKKAAVQSDLNINIHATGTPDLTAFVEVDKATGNILSASGNGNLDLVYTSRNNYFGINGTYNVTSGKYILNALNIINKEFTVRDGSTIRFNGDIMDTDLDIDGLYTTKASLSPLLGESASGSVDTRRTVECGFRITDRLRNPQIGLSITVPDLDPTTQGQVESALSTEDKLQKQFIYLLITGSFMPDDIGGVVNNGSDMLYSNVSSIMSNQINNILQKLDIPLDLGLNYKSTESGTDLFDVAVSTQLFQNRVIVNGTIGNREYSTSSGSTSVVGNLDIDIKLDRQGNVRLNLFSHAADQYSNYLDNSQRNGVGIAYQREFNTFRQFFRTLFQSRKKREENYLMDERRTRTRTIEIDEKGNAKND